MYTDLKKLIRYVTCMDPELNIVYRGCAEANFPSVWSKLLLDKWNFLMNMPPKILLRAP